MSYVRRNVSDQNCIDYFLETNQAIIVYVQETKTRAEITKICVFCRNDL